MSHAATPTLSQDQLRLPRSAVWRSLPWAAAAVGLLALVVHWLLGRGAGAARQAHFSYLVAMLYWLSIALGALFFVIVQFATKAGWSVVVRRLAEHAMITLPLLGLLFVPIVGGMHELFHWSHPEAMQHDALLASKAPYLNVPFFSARALLYFVTWTALAWLFYRRSVRQDLDGAPQATERLQRLSGPAIILFALTVTFAAFDWLMSLDPHWYSTMFGVYYFAGCVVAIFAFLALVGLLLRRARVLADVITVEHYHDLGKLLFGFTVFWTYIAFSQFMLIWYGNLPEETIWYARRLIGSWGQVTLVLALGHFVVPFFYLMTRATKRRGATLLPAALWLLTVHYLDLYWLVMPILHPEGARPCLLDLTAFLGVGGCFVALFGRQLRRHALVPMRDPRLAESLAFENY
ncbi:MAG: quinol:cytochrome C oxidoreductase [Proteobacteria bacterium]|nr:quinol:cytochrome C oxidoreductase [Pseudomonadota bacterium]